jgi:hypothetical protein
MEGASLEVKGLPGLSGPLLSGAQGPEVLHRLGDRVAEQTEDDPAAPLAPLDLDVEVHLVGDLLEIVAATTEKNREKNIERIVR